MLAGQSTATVLKTWINQTGPLGTTRLRASRGSSVAWSNEDDKFDADRILASSEQLARRPEMKWHEN